MIDSTEAKIGRWIKKRENTVHPQFGWSESSGGSELRDMRHTCRTRFPKNRINIHKNPRAKKPNVKNPIHRIHRE